jgi:hypothetical protein
MKPQIPAEGNDLALGEELRIEIQDFEAALGSGVEVKLRRMGHQTERFFGSIDGCRLEVYECGTVVLVPTKDLPREGRYCVNSITFVDPLSRQRTRFREKKDYDWISFQLRWAEPAVPSAASDWPWVAEASEKASVASVANTAGKGSARRSHRAHVDHGRSG